MSKFRSKVIEIEAIKFFYSETGYLQSVPGWLSEKLRDERIDGVATGFLEVRTRNGWVKFYSEIDYMDGKGLNREYIFSIGVQE